MKNNLKRSKEEKRREKIENIILVLCFIVTILTFFGRISMEIYFLVNVILSIPYHIFKENEKEGINRMNRERIAYLEKKINKKINK